MQKTFQRLRRFIGFTTIGVVIAAIGETQFSVFIRSDINNLIGSVVFNTLYILLAGVVSGILVTYLRDGPAVIVWHIVLFGICGLMIEWFLIGNSPWGNPQANQLGMFSYWSVIVVVPFVCLRPDARLMPLKKKIVALVLLYSLAASFIQLISTPEVQFVYHIWAVIIGYTALNVYTAIGYTRVVTGGGVKE